MSKPKLAKNPEDLAAELDYYFENQELLYQAFRHPSYVYENNDQGIQDNQTLEFLGDSVINLAISHLLMESFPEMKEGELSKCRASLVSENGLYPIACGLRLGDYLLTDAFEALIGAIYLDGGFTGAMRIIAELFRAILTESGLGKAFIDYKTELQEFSQNVFQATPEYRIEKEIGPDHNKTFYVTVYIKGDLMGKGKGKSKKEAERTAAQEALAWLRR
jgi:ribonuclease-3